jgi:calcineurin-like phosphoesterase
MRILFLGDVVGRAGRAAIADRLAGLKSECGVDFAIVNGENATGGHGLSPDHAAGLLAAGADCVTLGDHAFDQKDMLSFIDGEPRILRPLNIGKAAPGRGARRLRRAGRAAHSGRAGAGPGVHAPALRRSVRRARHRAARPYPRGGQVHAAFVDFHAEATSEKMAMGHFCDGRASAVVGTHTHVPTADAQVLPGGTGYLTDAGMCGDYNSVIGMEAAEPLRRFVTGLPRGRFTPALGPVTLSGVLVDTDDATGRATAIHPLRAGGVLAAAAP